MCVSENRDEAAYNLFISESAIIYSMILYNSSLYMDYKLLTLNVMCRAINPYKCIDVTVDLFTMCHFYEALTMLKFS